MQLTPETGATLAMANPKATVLVSFGLSNLKNVGGLIQSFHPKEIIIAGDNDSAAKNNTLKMTLDAKDKLEFDKIETKIMMPKKIEGREKTDWNDVHQLKGIHWVRNELGLQKNDDDYLRNTMTSIHKKEMKIIDNLCMTSNNVFHPMNETSLSFHQKALKDISTKTTKDIEFDI